MLKVPSVELKAFEINYMRDVLRCLKEAIDFWIRNCDAKWKVLWEALCHDSVSHKNLGIEIRDWYREKTCRDPRKVNCSMITDCTFGWLASYRFLDFWDFGIDLSS